MSVETLFMKAGNLKRVCEFTETGGKVWQAEPYAIYTSPKNRRNFLCYQRTEPEGWREIEARFVAAVKLGEAEFSARRDYEPFDKDRYPLMHYAIPTHDGRLRWGEKGNTGKSMSFLQSDGT